MRVALWQTAAGAEALDDALGRAAAAGADLLITPEMWASGYNVGDRVAAAAEPADGPRARQVAEAAARHGIAVVWGFGEAGPGKPYDAAHLVDRHGVVRATHRKAHLFGDLDHGLFTPGDRVGVVGRVDLADGTTVGVGLLICYDVEFPEAARLARLAGAELLAVPTGLMRPYDDIATDLVPARARENHLPLAYVNRTGREGDLDYCGLSCLLEADGAEVVRAGAGEDLLIGDVAPAPRGHDAEYLRDRRPELYAGLSDPTAITEGIRS